MGKKYVVMFKIHGEQYVLEGYDKEELMTKAHAKVPNGAWDSIRLYSMETTKG